MRISKGIKTMILVMGLSFMFNERVLAQEDVIKETEKIQGAYKNTPYLSFDIGYTYAAENAPSLILDSSQGNFKISGSRYWGMIDSVEFMQNETYSLVVYRPGKLINISSPKGLYPQVTGLAALDSFMGKNGYTYSMTTINQTRTLTLLFPDPLSPYKEFKISYDSTSYLIMGIAYVIKEEYMSGEANNGENYASGKYLQVRATYNNYNTNIFSDKFFETANYFKVNNGSYQASSPFADYEVFVSSPNLSSTQQSAH